jgi:hypothetical protein
MVIVFLAELGLLELEQAESQPQGLALKLGSALGVGVGVGVGVVALKLEPEFAIQAGIFPHTIALPLRQLARWLKL